MKKTYVYLLIGAAIVAIAITTYFFSIGSGPSRFSQNNQTSDQSPVQNNNSPVKFSDSQYANSAYLISIDSYDSRTQQALSGFDVNKTTLADGTLHVVLTAKSAEYQTQTYDVKPGQKLYFIEKSLGDDSSGSDRFLGDDHSILVDASGYIVQ
jgi:nitrogen fixation-related uncharacterized protein